MILGTIQYPSRYGGLGPGVKTGLKYLAEHDLSTLPLGRHVIDGDNIFFDVSEVTTMPANATLFEVQSMCMALAAITNDCHFLAIKNFPICILIIISFCHNTLSPHNVHK